jgi:hypothetical protein
MPPAGGIEPIRVQPAPFCLEERMRNAAGCLIAAALVLIPASPTWAQLAASEPGPLRAALAGSVPQPQAPEPQAPPPKDPLWDGIALGAAIGAGTSLGLTAISFARCDEGCEAPEPGPFYAISAAMGAAAGGVAGWLIDRARTPKPRKAVTLAPIVTKPRKGVVLTVTF